MLRAHQSNNSSALTLAYASPRPRGEAAGEASSAGSPAQRFPSLRVLDDLVVGYIARAPRCQRMEIIAALDLPETYVRRALPRLRARGRIVGEGVRAAMRYRVTGDDRVRRG